MNEEEIKAIGEKIKNGTSTPEEELALLKFLNQGMDQLKEFVKEVMDTNTTNSNN